MIQTKERIAGRETVFSLSVIQSIRKFFGVSEPESPSIPFFGEQYRTYKKKIVREGKAIKWGLPSTGTEKEKAGIRRIQKRYERSVW